MPIEELEILRTGNLSLNPKLRHIEIGSGEKINLTVLEFRLMFLLMGNPKKSISTNELIERVWGLHDFGNGAMVKNVVYRLRKKIEANPNEPVHLFTDAGFGYRFEP
jgi:two-component system response regulator RegX3